MLQTLTILLFGRPIGVLRLENDGYCAFQYTEAFCRTGIQPAPLQMPANPERVFRFPGLARETFQGLPGMIADSLPDSFGQALLNQWLTAQGRPEGQANALEKLSFLGTRGMGALEYRPARETYLSESSIIELQELIDTAQKALVSKESFQTCFRTREKAIADILRIGTSAGGQRAKAVIAFNEKTGEIRSGQVEAPNDFDYWLIKFDGFDSTGKPVDPAHFGRREYAFSQSVQDAGIQMEECRLLEENGRAHFMTRRFDRDNRQKLHMQTLCGMAHYDFRMPGAYSYEQAFATIRRLGLGYESAEELFRRMVFNIISVNMDDHTKNISFLMDHRGQWRLAPAYDMGFNYNPAEQWANAHQMTLRNKRDDITRNDLIETGREQDIRHPDEIIDEVEYGVLRFPEHAKEAGVPQREIDIIMQYIQEKHI